MIDFREMYVKEAHAKMVMLEENTRLITRLAEAENLLRDVREQMPVIPSILRYALCSYLVRTADCAPVCRCDEFPKVCQVLPK